MSYHSQGDQTLKVSMELFAQNRDRLCGKLKELGTVSPKSVVILQGGECLSIYDTDREFLFRQVLKLYLLDHSLTNCKVCSHSHRNLSFTGHSECWNQISLELLNLSRALLISLFLTILNPTVFGWEKFLIVSIIKRNTLSTMFIMFMKLKKC